VQPQAAEPDLHHIAIQWRRRTILGVLSALLCKSGGR